MKKKINVTNCLMICLVTAGISFAGCTKLRVTTAATGYQNINAPVTDSLCLYIYDSLGREFLFVKKYTRKVTPADTALFSKEAYIAYFNAIKTLN